jgi:HPt (histidine-containing phosphotransfer) domain-containing protein
MEPHHHKPSQRGRPECRQEELVHTASSINLSRILRALETIEEACQQLESGAIQQNFEFGRANGFSAIFYDYGELFTDWVNFTTDNEEKDRRHDEIAAVASGIAEVWGLVQTVWNTLPHFEDEIDGDPQAMREAIQALREGSRKLRQETTQLGS